MKKKFKDLSRSKGLTERHDRTIAEFLVNELVKFNLDSVFMGGDVYFTKFGKLMNLGFRNRLGATFEANRGEISVNLPSYDSAKDIPFSMYCSLIEDLKVFLSKLNKLIASLDDSEFEEVYNPEDCSRLEKKYSKFM